jgi:hypothetical protein
MICSLAPYLILDQNTTQEIFDNLFELTEKYNHYHCTLANNQVCFYNLFMFKIILDIFKIKTKRNENSE